MKKTYLTSALMLAAFSGSLMAQTLVTVNGTKIDSKEIDAQVKMLQSQSNGQLQDSPALRQNLSDRIKDLLDDWCRIAHDLSQQGATLQYQHEAGGPVRLLYEFLNRDAPPHWKFRANRSMRDVEPSVNLWLRDLDNQEIAE